jgi:hypothetical protein
MARALLPHKSRAITEAQNASSLRRCFMAAETELFYLVLLVMLTLIIHLVLSTNWHRGDKRQR